MKRIKLTEDELAIIEGLRQEKAIWNSAIEAALALFPEIVETDFDLKNLKQDILALRRL